MSASPSERTKIDGAEYVVPLAAIFVATQPDPKLT